MLVNYSSDEEDLKKDKKKQKKGGILVELNPDLDISELQKKHELE